MHGAPQGSAAAQSTPAPDAHAPSQAAAGPTSAGPAASADAVRGWQAELLGRLQHAKRYPDAARERDEQGVATVSFVLDRGGHVLSAALVRSSGSAALDGEALALVQRAEPLPPMPPVMAGGSIRLTVPITFALH